MNVKAATDFIPGNQISCILLLSNNGPSISMHIILKWATKQYLIFTNYANLNKRICSSLLLVYEGQAQRGATLTATTLQPYTTLKQDLLHPNNHRSLRSVNFFEHETSNSSDCLSQSDESHGCDEEPQACASKTNGFVPISEETVFLNSQPTEASASGHHNYGSSPMSMDGSAIYSSDYSQFTESSESSDMELGSQSWRRANSLGAQEKWAAPKELQRTRSAPRVDVRMIDFAHTTFGAGCSNSSVHHGPDNGFITGIDSLRRLLKEILEEA